MLNIEACKRPQPAPANALRVKVNHTTVGCAHDPYSRTFVTLTRGDRKAELVECALAGDSLTLYEGARATRQFLARQVWLGATPVQAKCDRTKVRLLCQRWLGADPQAERDAYENMRDPMGDAMGYNI
jgi:hypothetical protein